MNGIILIVGLIICVVLLIIKLAWQEKKHEEALANIDLLRKEIHDGREKCRVVQVRLHRLHHLGQLDGDGGVWISTVLIAPDDSLKACEKADRKIKYVPSALAPKQILGAPIFLKVHGTPYVMILGETYRFAT